MIEPLEQRRLMTTTMPFDLVDGVLSVSGTPQSDRIELEYHQRKTTSSAVGGEPLTTVEHFIRVNFNRLRGFLFKLDDVQSVVILGNGGDDHIDVRSLRLGVRADGGAGNDKIIGTDHPDTLVGGAGDDRLRGRGGDDRIDGSIGADRLLGGRGNDTLAAGVLDLPLLDPDDPIPDRDRDSLLGGPGDDRAHIAKNDRITEMERVRRD